MYSYGSPHTAAQKQDDQHERTFSSYVRIQVVVLKTYLGRWTIGRSGERGSGISVLPARYDDDDDDIYIYIYIYIYILLPKKGYFRITTNYRHIILTSITTTFYNDLLLNRIDPETEKIVRKNLNGFWRNRFSTSQILTTRQIFEGICAKNLEATLLFVDFFRSIRFHTQKENN